MLLLKFTAKVLLAYWNAVFMTGSNLFNNPLNVDTNGLNELFPARTTQQGTVVSLWNPNTATFDTTSTFTNGAWTSNLKLPPGTGVLVVAPLQFINLIVGIVLNHDGSILTSDNLTIPSVFSGSNGIYLLGDKSNGLAVVSWPSYAVDWTLQANSNLSTSSWGKYVGAVVNNTVTNIPNGNLFFRLSYP